MKKKIVAAFCLAMVMTVGGCSGTGTAAQPESSESQTQPASVSEPIIEQKYQDCCAICLEIPLESARYYAIIIKKERIGIKYKRNFRLFSRTTRQRPCWHENLMTAGRDNGPNASRVF